MEEVTLLEQFYNRIQIESQYTKKLNNITIELIINKFNYRCEMMYYPVTVENPLKLVLNFYKNYNLKYYQMIIDGINKRKINMNASGNYFDIKNNICNINIKGNDSDIFLLVHEFAHYIDRELKPHIILEKHIILCEVFSYYMELEFEKSLTLEYSELIRIRRNNRMHSIVNKVKMIELELYYEEEYLKQPSKFTNKINLNDARKLIKGNNNLVNTYLRYPIGIILANYLQQNRLRVSSSISNYLYELDIYDIIDKFCTNDFVKILTNH